MGDEVEERWIKSYRRRVLPIIMPAHVDREHVAGAEAAPEKVDQESQGGPPEDSASEESYDDEKSPSQAGDVEGFDRRNFENCEESQDIGNDQHEIGDRKAENRSEVLRKAGLAGPVAADLRYRF